jgi:hypothetical protein
MAHDSQQNTRLQDTQFEFHPNSSYEQRDVKGFARKWSWPIKVTALALGLQAPKDTSEVLIQIRCPGRGNSVGIATGYKLYDRRIGVRFALW